jgi:tRNA(Ile2) C34 agmatinyltransferase TiaS
MIQTQLTTQPISCPDCGRDAKPAGFNLVRCEMCGYVDRVPTPKGGPKDENFHCNINPVLHRMQ